MFETREEYKELQKKARNRPKINLYYDGSCAHFSNSSTQFFLQQAGLIAEFYNIHLLAPGDKPDLIWVASDKFDKKLLDINVPIIVEDVFQGPDIFDKCREIMKHDQVKIVLKAMATRDHHIHNSKLANYSIHQEILSKYWPEIQCEHNARHPTITEEDYNKVQISWNWIAWPHFRHGFNNDHLSLRDYYLDVSIPRLTKEYTLPASGSYITGERQYDVCFLGNINNWPEQQALIKKHRQVAWDIMNKCPGNNLLLQDDQCLGWHEYWQKLRQSKIIVSPWGWEPITIRDVEAVLAGCILIKPDTTFLQTYPHIPHIRCKPDFSDLESLIETSLKRWDTTEDMRRTSYDHLLNTSNTMTTQIYDIVRDALIGVIDLDKQ